jgi:hypothetical protein
VGDCQPTGVRVDVLEGIGVMVAHQVGMDCRVGISCHQPDVSKDACCVAVTIFRGQHCVAVRELFILANGSGQKHGKMIPNESNNPDRNNTMAVT